MYKTCSLVKHQLRVHTAGDIDGDEVSVVCANMLPEEITTEKSLLPDLVGVIIL